MTRYVVCALFLCMALGGCANDRPSEIVDLNEYMFEQALQDCYDKTRNIVRDATQLHRQSYFDQCMEDRGYGRETYKHLWINI